MYVNYSDFRRIHFKTKLEAQTSGFLKEIFYASNVVSKLYAIKITINTGVMGWF